MINKNNIWLWLIALCTLIIFVITSSTLFLMWKLFDPTNLKFIFIIIIVLTLAIAIFISLLETKIKKPE